MTFILKALRRLRFLNRPLPGWLTLALVLSSGAVAATPLYYGTFHAAVNGAYITAESSTPHCGYTPSGLYVSDATGATPYVAFDTSGDFGVCGNANVVGTATAGHLTSGDISANLNLCSNGSSIITTSGCSTSSLGNPFCVGSTCIGTNYSGTVSGVGASLLGFKVGTGSLQIAFDTLGDVGVEGMEAQTYGSPNFGASLPVCTDSFPHLVTTSATCNIKVVSYNNGGTTITVVSNADCLANTLCTCTGASGCDATDHHYHLTPYTGCQVINAFAGFANATAGVDAYVGNNTGSGTGGDTVFFYNTTGVTIPSGTNFSFYVQCGGPA